MVTLRSGPSRFLQAHIDLLTSQAPESGQFVPDIAIVQVSDDPGPAQRLPAFADPAGFPVLIRGLDDEARRYVATTRDRLANPYLDHSD